MSEEYPLMMDGDVMWSHSEGGNQRWLAGLFTDLLGQV